MVFGVDLHFVLMFYRRQIQQRGAGDVKQVALLKVPRGNNLLAFKDFVVDNCKAIGNR